MRKLNKILSITLLIMLTIELSGCAGCAHRQKRRVSEQRTYRDRELKSDVKGNRDRDLPMLSAEKVESLARSNDYDAMIDCLSDELVQIKKLRKDYFRGNMTDKEAEKRMQDIVETYRPIMDAIEQASSNGDLNYNQHKKQIKLLGEYMSEVNSVGKKFSEDIDIIFR